MTERSPPEERIVRSKNDNCERNRISTKRIKAPITEDGRAEVVRPTCGVIRLEAQANLEALSLLAPAGRMHRGSVTDRREDTQITT